MAELQAHDWAVIVGLGSLWLGVQIVAVARPPRALRRGPQPSAPKGTPAAFGLFWIDQYAYLGLTLSALGALAALWGRLA